VLQQFGPTGELGTVAAPELAPTFRVVSEPFAKLGARRDLLEPLVEPGFRLADPARPKAVNQDAVAILGLRRVVGSLEPDVRSGDRAGDDSGDLRKRASERAGVRTTSRTLELDFGEEPFMIAVNHRHGLLAPVSQIGDRAVPVSIEPSITISSHFSAWPT
jgi:hypothetical protein